MSDTLMIRNAVPIATTAVAAGPTPGTRRARRPVAGNPISTSVHRITPGKPISTSIFT